jgi:hypothetical protein
MLAVVPLGILVISVIRNPKMRSMRWWVGLLAALYTTALLIWALSPDPAPSLSKDLSPVLGSSIVAASIAVILKLATRRKR